ncbi:MAG: pseudouridine synthase, partial [Thermoanaerobaculia bacterium]
PGLRRSVAKASQEGRRAVTRYRTLERLPGTTLVSVRPETGRTHQIRVHFAAAGHPILGDRVYGPEGGPAASGAARQMLHARRLGFPHPSTGEPVSAEAPLPEDFAALLERLRSAKKKAPAEPAREKIRKRGIARRER